MMEGNYVLFLAHGGRRSGKSFAGAAKAILYGKRYSGAAIVVLAPTAFMMKAFTWRVFIEVLGILELKEETHWVWNETNKELRFLFNKSYFMFRTASNLVDAEKLRGGSLAAFWIDEARNVPEVAFYNLLHSLSQGVEEINGMDVFKYPLMGWVTSTPAGRKHWLYDVFYTEHEEGFRYLAFPASSMDNPFGGRQLYEHSRGLVDMQSPYGRQEFFGEFTVMEGLVFPEYDPNIHDVASGDWPVEPRFHIGGIDFGYSAPLAIVAVGYTPIDRNIGYRFIRGEIYKTRMSVNGIILACKALKEKYNIRTFMCDSAEPRIIGEINRAGVHAQPVSKGRGSALYHKLLCSSALTMKHNGKSTFFVDSQKVPNWKFEIESYAEKPVREGWNPDERPQPDEDHAMQAWGYAEAGLARSFRGNAKALRKLSLRM